MSSEQQAKLLKNKHLERILPVTLREKYTTYTFAILTKGSKKSYLWCEFINLEELLAPSLRKRARTSSRIRLDSKKVSRRKAREEFLAKL